MWALRLLRGKMDDEAIYLLLYTRASDISDNASGPRYHTLAQIPDRQTDRRRIDSSIDYYMSAPFYIRRVARTLDVTPLPMRNRRQLFSTDIRPPSTLIFDISPPDIA